MSNLFTTEEESLIESKITELENCTSAELKVVIVNYCWGNLIHKAQNIFEKHNLHKTEQRNAVMVLLVVKNRELLIYGDTGINSVLEKGFWVNTKDEMISCFKKGQMVEGMTQGLQHIGTQLLEYFPSKSGDINELPNGIIYEK
jgi:uncharacterized membrane protein